jgi:uncharacterized delta-60 repeat protein
MKKLLRFLTYLFSPRVIPHLALVWVLLPNIMHAQNGTPVEGSITFPLWSGTVNVMKKQGEKLLIGGDFEGNIGNQVIRDIARLNPDGTLDRTFNPGMGSNGSINTIAFQGNQIILGGSFTTFNDTPCDGIVRLSADGTLDNTFSFVDRLPNPTSSPLYSTQILVQSDNRILVVGSLGERTLIRLLPDGDVDNTFDFNSPGGVISIGLQSDDKIIVGGTPLHLSNNGTPADSNDDYWSCLVRLNSDGSVDEDFILNGRFDNNLPVAAGTYTNDGPVAPFFGRELNLIVDDNDRITYTLFLYDGNYYHIYYADIIGRLLPDGTPDQAFAYGLEDLTIDPRGYSDSGFNKLFPRSSGYFVQTDGLLLSVDAGTANGNDWLASVPVFIQPSNITLYSISDVIVEPNDTVLLGGRFDIRREAGIQTTGVIRLNSLAELDSTFQATAKAETVYSQFNYYDAATSKERHLLGGSFLNYQNSGHNNITRLVWNYPTTSSFVTDPTFDPGTGTNGPAYVITRQADGKFLIGGSFTEYNGVPRNNLVRINTDGSLDESFIPPLFDNPVYAITEHIGTGQIFIGGGFTQVGGVVRNYIAALHSIDGSLDNSYNPTAGPNGLVYKIDLYRNFYGQDPADNRLFISGGFTQYDNEPRSYWALINPDGSLDDFGAPQGFATAQTSISAFQSSDAESVAPAVYAAVPLPDGGVILGGEISQFNGRTVNNLVKINADGTMNETFVAGTDGPVRTIYVQANGKIVIAGEFENFNGKSRKNIARMTADGSLDFSFNPGTGASGPVYSISITENGTVSAAGNFNSFNGIPTDNTVALQIGLPEISVVREENFENEISSGGNFNFGEVAIGETGTQTFLILNIGDDDLQLTEDPIVSFLGITSPDFQIEFPPVANATVAPGGFSQFTVKFSPSEAGRQSAQIIIHNSDQDEAEYIITIVGNKEIQTIDGFAPIDPKIYGDEFVVSATSSSNLPVTFISSNTDIATVDNNGNVKIRAVGNGEVTITAFQNGNDVFAAAQQGRTFTVTKAPLTVKAENKTKVYGSPDLAFTLEYEGFVNGDDHEDITPPTIETNGTSSSNAGEYPIVLSGGSSSNYNILLQNGTLTITKASLIVAAENKARVYGSSNPALTIAYEGLVNGDDNEDINSPTIETTATASSNAGEYPIVLSGGSSGNYDIALQNGTLTVAKAPLIATAENKTKIYGSANPAFTLAYQGFVNGDDSEDIIAPSIEISATTTSNAGEYPIVLSGGVSANYDISFQTGTLTVAKASLVVTAENKTKVYGSANPAFTISYEGFVNDDDPDDISIPMITTDATLASNVGEYAIILSGGSSLNYDLTLRRGTLVVTKADQTITFNAVTAKTFGDAPFELDATTNSGLPLKLIATPSDRVLVDNNVVTLLKPGQITITASQEGDGNYNAAHSISQTFCINPAKPEIGIEEENTESPVLTSGEGEGMRQWYRNGTVVEGETAPVLNITQHGGYTVTVTAEGCVSEESDLFPVIVTANEATTVETKISVFPNPVEDEAFMSLDGFAGDISIRIVDAQGRTVQQIQTAGGTTVSMDTRDYTPGLYHLILTQTGKRVTLSFIKK